MLPRREYILLIMFAGGDYTLLIMFADGKDTLLKRHGLSRAGTRDPFRAKHMPVNNELTLPLTPPVSVNTNCT